MDTHRPLRRKLTFRAHGRKAVFVKWNTPLAALEALVAGASAKCRRTAAVDLISFPPGSDRGHITVLPADLAWRCVPPSGSPERPH